MRWIKSWLSCGFFLIFLMTFFSGCLEDSEQQIQTDEQQFIGEWRFGDNYSALFFETGTYSSYNRPGGEQTGNWSLLDGIITIEYGNFTKQWKYYIYDDPLNKAIVFNDVSTNETIHTYKWIGELPDLD